MLYQYVVPLVFIVLGTGFVAFAVFVPKLIRISNLNPKKSAPYECGEEALGSPWVRFNTRFYVVAIIFIIFDVEVLFLFPWAVVYRYMSLPVGTDTGTNLQAIGLLAFTEVFVFVLILAVGLAYVWKKGHLDWVLERRTLPSTPTGVIPKEQRRGA